MADQPLTTPARSLAGRFRPALRIGLIYLVARLVTTAMLLLAAQLSGFESRFGPEPTLGDLVLGWDSRWYWIVA